MRSFFRNAIVVILTAVALLTSTPDLFANWIPWGTFGFGATVTGRITDVFPESSAARAGIVPGDTIIVPHNDRVVYRTLAAFSQSRPGDSVDFRIRSHDGTERTVRLLSTPWPRSTWDNISNIALVLAFFIAILIPAWLVITRPSWSTWSFFLFSIFSGFYSAELYVYGPQWIYPFQLAWSTNICIGAWALVIFAAVFPNAQPSPRLKRTFALLTIPFAAFAIAEVTVWTRAATDYAANEGAVSTIATINGAAGIAVYVCALIVFAMRYMRSDSVSRARLRWVAAGFILSYGGPLFGVVVVSVPGVQFTPPLAFVNFIAAFVVFAPFSVSYAIAKHRVIDIRFALSRALVYGVLTTCAVAVLALLEYFVAHQLEETRLGSVVEVIGAVAIGLGMQRAHKTIDDLVDRYVFRTVHDAERRFHVVGRSMMFADSTRGIDALLVDESISGLRLTGAAVYHPSENGYTRMYAAGYDFADILDRDHRTVLYLLAEHEPVERDGELAVPLTLRNQLVGFALFGHHQNGTAIDPTERELLASFCHRAAVAYDHMISEQRASEIQRLQVENDVLRSLAKAPV